MRPISAPGTLRATMTAMTAEASVSVDIIETAREQVLERGEALRYEQITQVLRTPDGRLEELLALAHDHYDRGGWAPDGAVKDDLWGGAAIRDLRYRRDLS